MRHLTLNYDIPSIIKEGEISPIHIAKSSKLAIDDYNKTWYDKVNSNLQDYKLSYHTHTCLLSLALHTTMDNLPLRMKQAKEHLHKQTNAKLSKSDIINILKILFG